MPYFTNRGIIPLPAAPAGTTTWNPADKSADLTLDVTNLIVTGAGTGTFNNVRTIASASTGKKYWEIVATTETLPNSVQQGFGNASATLTSGSASIGDNTNSIGWRGSGAVVLNASTVVTYQGWAQGDTLCFALDMTNGKIWFRTNGGNWNNDVIGNQNPATNTGGYDYVAGSMAAGPYFAMCGTIVSGDVYTTNFGASAYAQTPPSGFSNW